jgi:WD40 repeat protein
MIAFYKFSISRLAGCVVPIVIGGVAAASGQAEDPPGRPAPPITALAFTPDGNSIVAGSQAGLTVHRWPGLEREATLDTTLVQILDLAFSPAGDRLAAAGGTPSEAGQVEVYAWPSGESLFVAEGHRDTVSAVAWRNGDSFATAGHDHEIVLWDVASREPARRLAGHSRGVASLCFLPGANQLVSGGLDQNLRVWDLSAGTPVRTLNNHTREIHQLALRPAAEGLPLVASVSDDRTVRLWQPTIGRMVRFLRFDTTPLTVAWLPAGNRLAVGCADGRVRVIDPERLEIVSETAAGDGWVYALTAHPRDGSLVAGGQFGQLTQIKPEPDHSPDPPELP